MNIEAKPECNLPVPLQVTLTNSAAPNPAVQMFRLAMTIIILMLLSVMEIGKQMVLFTGLEPIQSQVSLLPLMQLSAWGNAIMGLMILSMLSLPKGINVIMYMPLFFIFVNQLMINRYLDELTRRSQNQRNRFHVRGLVGLLTASYLMMMPVILQSDLMCYGIFCSFWLPQIMANLGVTFQDRHFKYRIKFLIVQSVIMLLLPFEARAGGVFFRSDYDESVFKLRPHPQMVKRLIMCFAVQITILWLQQTNMSVEVQRVCLRIPHWMPFRQSCLRSIRRLKLKGLRKVYMYTRKFTQADYDALSETESATQRSN